MLPIEPSVPYWPRARGAEIEDRRRSRRRPVRYPELNGAGGVRRSEQGAPVADRGQVVDLGQAQRTVRLIRVVPHEADRAVIVGPQRVAGIPVLCHEQDMVSAQRDEAVRIGTIDGRTHATGIRPRTGEQVGEEPDPAIGIQEPQLVTVARIVVDGQGLAVSEGRHRPAILKGDDQRPRPGRGAVRHPGPSGKDARGGRDGLEGGEPVAEPDEIARQAEIQAGVRVGYEMGSRDGSVRRPELAPVHAVMGGEQDRDKLARAVGA